MSMFDYYRPAGKPRCPICLRLLGEWQGKDGPNGLFVWVEGARYPVDQAVEDDARIDRAAQDRLVLPQTFIIYSYDCPEHQPVEAECRAPVGVWNETVVRPFKGASLT